MTKPSVAVITRTKNRPKLLERALRSVHSQTYTDFVHIVINDGGNKSNVDEIIRKTLEQTGGRVSVIHNQNSSGMEAASNKAIKSVDSDYIAIHDDDDTWHPEFLARAIAQIAKSGAMGVVVRTDKIMEELNNDGTTKRKQVSRYLPDVKAINLYRQCIDNQMTPITFLYRRKVFDEIGYYDEALPVCGDWDFGIRFLKRYDIDFLDPGFALANYHHRVFKPGAEGNTSYAGNEKAVYWTNYLMNKYLREELDEGRLGVGYIMSKLRYNEKSLSKLVGRVLPGFIFKLLKNKVRG